MRPPLCRVVHEKDDGKHLASIQQVVAEANIVVCLGWAYEIDTIGKLNIPDLHRASDGDWDGARAATVRRAL